MTERIYISLSDIKCQEIVEKIKFATQIIRKFYLCVNRHLEEIKLEEPKIIISRIDQQVYEDDGYTKTPGYEYEVYWFFPYINLGENYINVLNFEPYMWPPFLMFFSLKMEERISDTSLRDNSFFKLYITDDSNNTNCRVESYNNNYQLTAMLNSDNILYAIEKINRTYKKYKEKKQILKELNEIEISEKNVKNYIEDRIIKLS